MSNPRIVIVGNPNTGRHSLARSLQGPGMVDIIFNHPSGSDRQRFEIIVHEYPFKPTSSKDHIIVMCDSTVNKATYGEDTEDPVIFCHILSPNVISPRCDYVYTRNALSITYPILNNLLSRGIWKGLTRDVIRIGPISPPKALTSTKPSIQPQTFTLQINYITGIITQLGLHDEDRSRKIFEALSDCQQRLNNLL